MNVANSDSHPLLRCSNVSRFYGQGEAAVHALTNINLTFQSGKLIALVGKSGSGKTTILNILATLEKPSRGQVFYGDRLVNDMSEKQKNQLRKREIGLIFQSFALVQYMSAYENVEMGLRIAGGYRKSERKLRAEQALEFVGLGKRMKHRPAEMSGGEQQRTAIARAIAHKPALILADEPTAELDTRMGIQVIQVFRELVEVEGTTVVLTTHDPAIMDLVDAVYSLEGGYIV